MTRWILAPLTALLFFTSAQVVTAGTFFITDVSAVRQSESQYYVGVSVPAMAQYMGTLDRDDNGYLLQTFLNDALGGDLNDWNNPDSFGSGNSGSGIVEGQVLSCTGGCAAYMNIYKAVCPDDINYRGKGGVTIYHQFSPEIDLDYTYVYATGCYYDPDFGGGDDEPGPGCNSASLSATTSSTLTVIDDATMLAAGPGTFVLSRQDHQDEMEYLLEEWAILQPSATSGPSRDVEVLNASSPGFATAAAARLRGRGADLPARPVLVLDSVNHPLNERFIPTPTVHLSGPLVQGIPPGAGRAVVRADFSESGELGALDVFYASEAVPSKLLEDIKARVEIEYQTSGRHRAISFMVLGFGDGPVQVLDSQTVLPACCCSYDPEGAFRCV